MRSPRSEIARVLDRSITRRAALALLLFAGACVAPPPPPYELAFQLEVHSPRLLESSQEVTVPLTIVNTGRRAWDPTTIHLSYHWLWFVPREMARRSRTVPYHEGIRTELGQAVAPGARVSTAGRVLAPRWPGLYWLQWDMVEEGVTWFAQVSPRQPRTLVVVLPPAAWLFAPVPLLIAALALRRRRRSFAADDVVWCAATLAVKPLILAHDALLEPTAVAYWLVLAAAIIVPVLAWLVLPGRLRPWALVAIGTFASLLLLADVVYYRFFGDLVSAPALLAAHQTGRVWGTVGSLFTPGLVWLVADLPFGAWLAARTARAELPRLSVRAIAAAAAVASVALGGLALSAPRVLASTPLDQMFRARSVVEQLGPFGYHAYDAWNYIRAAWLRPPATETEIADAAAWFRERAPRRRGGQAFGAARGRNLIVVQVESLQDFVVDFSVGGQAVMPHLRAWARDSLRFTNVTDQTSEGRTSDAEFAAMTSLLPLDHGAAAFRFPANHYTALPRVLVEHGYATLSAVAFEPGFWNRQVMHPAYGFQQSLFEPDFHMTEQIGWGLNDRDFLQQMIPRLEALRRPFAAWLITLSLHHPFEGFPAAHKALTLGPLEGTSFGNYLHAMHFFDQAIDEFRAALARDGLLDGSVLVVFGDHDAGFARDPALARTIGIGADEIAWTLNDRIPVFVRTGGGIAADGLVGENASAAGQIDFAPTLLSLLGIDAATLPYLGHDLLERGVELPVPRPYGDWLDAHHLFLARGSASLCVDLARRTALTADACAGADASVGRERDVSRLVIVDDLQQRLRDALGGRGR